MTSVKYLCFIIYFFCKIHIRLKFVGIISRLINKQMEQITNQSELRFTKNSENQTEPLPITVFKVLSYYSYFYQNT
jgi:hypothetical protein